MYFYEFFKHKIYIYFNSSFSIQFQRLLKLEETNKMISFLMSHFTNRETDFTNITHLIKHGTRAWILIFVYKVKFCYEIETHL